jgi:hypothetical protein
MTNSETNKGPARIRVHPKGLMADVLIFDEQFAYMTKSQAKIAIKLINKSLSPILRKAALCDRIMQKKPKFCQGCNDEGFWAREVGGCDPDGENDTREVIQERCEWCETIPDSFFNLKADYEKEGFKL